MTEFFSLNERWIHNLQTRGESIEKEKIQEAVLLVEKARRKMEKTERKAEQIEKRKKGETTGTKNRVRFK